MAKKILAGILLLLLLTLTGAFVLFKTKGDALIEKFSAYVEETTGEPLSIAGTPNLSFLPSPGLELGRATWGRPDGPIFVTFSRASVRISASALLTGTLRIIGLSADELDVAIRIEDRPAPKESKEEPKEESKEESNQNVPPHAGTSPQSTDFAAIMQRDVGRILDMLPDSLEVTKGRLRLTQRDGSVITLNGLDLKLNNERAAHAVAAVANALAEYTGDKPVLPGLPPHVAGQVALNFNASLKDSLLALDLSSASLNPTAGFPFAQTVSISGKGEYALNSGALNVQSLQAELPGLSASAHGSVTSVPTMLTDAMHRGAATIQVNLTGSPRELLLAVGKELQTSHPNALTKANFAASATLQEGVLTISKLEGALDDTPVSGNLRMGLTRPSLSGDLTLGDLNLDALLPPASDQEGAPQTTKSATPPSKTDVDQQPRVTRTITAPSWPELNLTVNINSLTVKGLTLSEIHARSEGAQGNYAINPLSLRMFGSPVTASLSATVFPSTFPPTPESHAMFSANISASGINLEEAGRYFLNKDTITGQGSLNATLSCSSDAPVRTLSGKGSLSAEPLHIKADLLPPNSGMTPQSPATGKFDKGLLTFVAHNGIITIESASLTAPRLALNGTGTINLPAQSLELAGTLQIPGLAVLPVRLAGPLKSPSYSLNAKTTLDAVSKTLQEHGVDVKKEIERGLGALFKKR